MKFTASLAAELANLTAALDEPGADVGQDLHQLAAAAALAVPSYLGLSVSVNQHDSPYTITLLDHGVTAGEIGTSIRLALPDPGAHHQAVAVAFILYAGSPGAFVDLAADVAWLTGRPLTDFVLDEHLAAPHTATLMAEASVVNQAIGVLIGRGYTPQQANWELDTQASHGGTDRLTAAHLILARITPGGDDQFDIH